jgi:hypothetical protein
MSSIHPRTISRTACLSIMFASILVLMACGTTGTGSSPPAEVTQDNSPVVDQSGPDPEVVELYGGDGMLIPLNGSSLEAFNASLAKVEKHTSTKSYRTLVAAIDYLLLYELSVERDRTLLAKKLDGMNGNEIVERVRRKKL